MEIKFYDYLNTVIAVVIGKLEQKGFHNCKFTSVLVNGNCVYRVSCDDLEFETKISWKRIKDAYDSGKPILSVAYHISSIVTDRFTQGAGKQGASSQLVNYA